MTKAEAIKRLSRRWINMPTDEDIRKMKWRRETLVLDEPEDNNIISQFRKMRHFQRTKLANELYPEYAKELKEFLCEITREYNNLVQQLRDAEAKGTGLFGASEYSIQVIKAGITECEQKRNYLQRMFDSFAERTVKLSEFDIKTERRILEAMCKKENICSSLLSKEGDKHE